MSKARAAKVNLESIQRLRTVFLQEMNTQVRYNACHERGMSDSYLLTLDELEIGYGSVKGKEDLGSRDAVFEFFVLPPFRAAATLLFREVLNASGASWIECQSNDSLLSGLLFEHAGEISAEAVLFADQVTTFHEVAAVTVRRRQADDAIFTHTSEPVGEYVAVADGRVAGTAGFLCHYNLPFADLFMEVDPRCRRRGVGTLLVQEVKRECYLAGRVPAARCGVANEASRATLLKAGMGVSGYMLAGRVLRR